MASVSLARFGAAYYRAGGHVSLLKRLYIQVLIAILIGIFFGEFFPNSGIALKPLGDAFISLVRAVVPPLIFATVAGGIAKMGDMRRVGVVGLRAIVYFEVMSTVALLVGLAVANILPMGTGLHINPATLDPKPVASFVAGAQSFTIVDFLVGMVPTSMIGDLAKGNMMSVLIMSVLFGFALIHLGERGQRLAQLIDDFTAAIFALVRIVMYLAPLAAFAAMAFTVGKFGFGTLASLGKLIGGVYLTSILFVFLGFGAVARMFGLRLWSIICYFKDELLIAFSATSGEAMIPRSIAKLENLGCSKEVVGLVLPTGFSFNMDGTAIYMSLSVLFVAQATDIHLSLAQQLTLLLIMLFTSKGAAGVTGGGFVALAATMPAIGILPIGGLALLLGVDRFMSEIRAVTNLFSNIFATVVVAKWMGEIDEEKAARALIGSDAMEPGVPAVVSEVPAE